MRRIQRKRTKGWKNPDNTVYVGRPTRWGNPFPVGKWVRNNSGLGGLPGLAWEISDAAFPDGDGMLVETAAQSLMLYEEYAKLFASEIRKELRGKDLACWCDEASACHGDILLGIANETRYET